MSLHILRRRTLAVATTIAATATALVLAGSAGANLPDSGFEGGDGNLVVTTGGNTDWANVTGVATGIDKPSGTDDNALGQGSKEDVAAVSVVTGSIPPNKNDLTRFYLASTKSTTNHSILNLAWQRAVNTGSANIDFEINKNVTANFTAATTGPVTLNRTAGDMLVAYDFGGSGAPVLSLNRWLTAAAGNTAAQCFSANALPCWGLHATLTGAQAEGAVNTGSVSDPLQSPAVNLGVGLFGEASIDLTAAGVFPSNVCTHFGSAMAKSRSSSSFTAEVKDFIAPQGINITNCGTVTINKVTQNGDSSFGFTSTGGLSPATFSLSNGGTQSYTGSVFAGNYTVTENITGAQTTAGWSLLSLSCSSSGGATQSTNGSTASFTMSPGGSVSCTYTNRKVTQSTISTAQDLIPNDSVTLGNISAGAGTSVTFSLYPPSNPTCSGATSLTQTVNVSGPGTYSTTNTTFHATTPGTWRWKVVYTGDSFNLGSTSACGVEQFTIVN